MSGNGHNDDRDREERGLGRGAGREPGPRSGESITERASRSLGDAIKALDGARDLDAMDNEALMSMVLGTEIALNPHEQGLDSLVDDPDLWPWVEALRAAQVGADGGDLDPADHEAILAMTLGCDVAGGDTVAGGEGQSPSSNRSEHASLKAALRALHEAGSVAPPRDRVAPLIVVDAELILAMSVGVEPILLDKNSDLGSAQNADQHAELCAALRALAQAADPQGSSVAFDDLHHERSIRRAVSGASASSLQTLRTEEGDSNVAPIAPRRMRGMVLALTAVAAMFAVFFASLETGTEQTASSGLALTASALLEHRSTDDLFDAQPFPRMGGETGRIGTIVSSRADDLRANRFRVWGVE